MLPLIAVLGVLAQTVTFTASPDVHLHLSLARPRPLKLGQPIVVTLSFVADRRGYEAEVITSNPSSKGDDFAIAPETGVFRWLARVEEGGVFGRDYVDYEPLSSNPVEVQLTLNDYVRFDAPGDYTIRLTTHRVRDARDQSRWLAVTSDELSIHLDAMSDAEEGAQVRQLRALIDATSERDYERQGALCHALGYLTGDVAAQAKADLYLHPSPKITTSCFNALSQGFLISRHPAIVLTAFESAMADLSQPTDTGVVDTAAALRGWMRTLARTPGTPPDPATVRGISPGRYDVSRDEYVRSLTESLSRRSGVSRARTAATIMMLSGPPWGPALSPDARTAVVEGFDDLDKYEQDWMVGSHWREIRDPSLAPSLERMVANDISVDNALQALLDVAPDRARPLIVAEIVSAQPRTFGGALLGLPDDTLADVNATLVAQLRRLTGSPGSARDFRVTGKAQLVARYGTTAIFDDVAALYRERGRLLDGAARAALLVYLIRNNPAADALFARELNAADVPSSFLSWVQQAVDVRSRAAVARALTPAIESDDARRATAAVFTLRQVGSPANRDSVRKRLDRWLNVWRPRAAELEADPKLSDEGQLQIELLAALKEWATTAEEKATLQSLCLTTKCRALFAAR